MKYLQLTIYYQKAFEAFNKYNSFESSDEILNAIKNSYIESHRWPYFLNKKKFEIKNILVNHFEYQHKWAKENGIKLKSSKNWSYEITYNQIKKFKPDIIFITSEQYFSSNFLKKIKEDFIFIKKIIVWQGILIENKKQISKFNYIDEVFTSSEFIKKSLSKLIKTNKIFYAFDKNILNVIPKIKKQNEVLFLGNIFLERNLHGERADYINEIINHITFFKVHTNVSNYKFKNYIKNYIFKMLKISENKSFHLIDELKFYKQLMNISKVNYSGNYYGIEQYNILNKSLIIFNKHINNSNYAANIRLFEPTGLGSCFLTDNLLGLDELFDLKTEIVTYNSKLDMIDKINYLTNNPKEAVKIGNNAQKKILNKHTFDIRVLEFEYLLQKQL